MKGRDRIGCPRYRRGTVALMVVTAACSGDSCSTPVGPVTVTSNNVHIEVFMTGDGDGEVEVTDSASWSCVLTAGSITQITTTGSSTAQSDRCSRSFYDAGAGSVRFLATAAPGSAFGGWSTSCSGTTSDCTVMWNFGSGGADISVGAEFLFAPSAVTVQVVSPEVTQGLTTQATAATTASRTLQDVQYTWTSSNPSVASVTGSGAQATVTGLSPGTTEISATARGVPSNAVTVTVGQLPSGQGILRGRVLDGTTPMDSIYVIVEPLAGSSGTSGLRWWSGDPLPLEPGVIPPGGFLFEVASGPYVVGVSGLDGNRWVSTSGDTTLVLAGDTTVSDRDVRRGYHLDMLNTGLTVSAAAGGNVDVTLDFRAWNRIHCPGCVPSIAIGVEGEPVAVHRFDSPGTYPGQAYLGRSISFNAPSAGGTMYAVLVIASTAASLEPGFEEYRRLWADPLKLRFIPIGTLQVN